MGARIEHRASFSAPVSTVYSALVDKAYLSDRLAALGGQNSALLDHEASGDRASFRVRQGLPAEQLPSTVRNFLGGDLVVEREETWRLEGGKHVATTRARIPGMPAEITGRVRLEETADGGTDWVTDAEVKVNIPLLGGKLERSVAEPVAKLLAAESQFAGTWLAEHRPS
ncbi:DUF2505 domain-containing protein [Labedaea rhizosphaerae]|uniref:Uncharacterized protein DUF2505 n=1 Tax=Labedaea rhizosphaerae TaxID=598644 RepID=A0A4R6SPR6_LABRH|nr:DUF2505 domain-containing protein [Labedaea rhizosphaerae]TDQ05570.1 uncharacterized protein DUF2505 [Labedaea rhizosphaerae]